MAQHRRGSRLCGAPLVLLSLAVVSACRPTLPSPTAVASGSQPASPSASPAAELILCQDRVFDGYTTRPFVLDGGVAADPSVLKIIRGCTFRNSTLPAIVLADTVNVLIEDNLFEDIRTNIPGDGVHGIYVRGDRRIDRVIIRGNTFRRIGADGMQLGDTGRHVTNIVIEQNTFSGSAEVGENGIDVKGVDGPIVIRGNTWSGFRPCESPKKGGTQDCSGSDGAGIVVHEGEGGGRPHGVTVIDNVALDNTRGMDVSHADDVTIVGNTFRGSLEWDIFVGDVSGCTLGTNTFEGSSGSVVVQESDCRPP